MSRQQTPVSLPAISLGNRYSDRGKMGVQQLREAVHSPHSRFLGLGGRLLFADQDALS
jgi:hypothetical protein